MKIKTEKKVHHNVKVAKNRTKKWKMSIADGKLDVQISPTRIRLLRLKSRKTQRTMADALKVSLATYGSIERGKRIVKDTTAQKIAKLINAKIPDIFLRHAKSKTKVKYVAVK